MKKKRSFRRIKKAMACIALIAAGYMACGFYDGDQKLVEETYTVKHGDTFWDISEAYLKKNTGGRRYILEFQEGIKQLNPELLETHCQLKPGQKLRINYWVKDERGE